MVRHGYASVVAVIMIGLVIGFVAGCADMPMKVQNALGRDIAEKRSAPKEESCPTMTAFSVTPAVVKCGGQVTLRLAAMAPTGLPLNYSWEIDGQTFETGQHAIWNTPTSDTIGHPEKTYTVRGVASDGQCSVTQAIEVTVLCTGVLDAMVNFEFGRAELDMTSTMALDEIGEKLQDNPTHAVLVEGHADYIGTEPDNDRLGARRAEAVKTYLLSVWNIDPSRVLTRSFGELRPIASNESPDGRAQNRRAVIYRVLFSTLKPSSALEQK